MSLEARRRGGNSCRPGITVVIPCFNCENTIRRAIDSCNEFPEFDVEIIAVDDGSTDGTLSILNSLELEGRIKVISLEENRGVSYARNTGVRAATAGHLIFLDSDDFFLSGAGELAHSAIASFPDLALYCFGYLINGKKSPRPAQSRLALEFIKAKFSNTNTILCKTSVLRANPFDVTHRIGEDTSLWFQLLCKYSAMYFGGEIASYEYIPKVNAVKQHPLMSLNFSELGVDDNEARLVRHLIEKNTDMRLAFARGISLIDATRKLGAKGAGAWLCGPRLFKYVWFAKQKLSR